MNSLRVVFLDAGQGDCTLVAAPGAVDCTVIDCPGQATALAVDRAMSLGTRGVRLAIITHSDSDHSAGVVDFIHGMRGDCTEVLFELDREVPARDPDAYKLLKQQLIELMRAGSRIEQPLLGRVYAEAGATITLVHPAHTDKFEAPKDNFRNECAIMVEVKYKGRVILVGSDVGGYGWQCLLRRGSVCHVDVLRMSHHGAWHERGARIPEILNALTPDATVLSVGTSNPYDHPDERTLEAIVEQVPNARIVCTELTAKCEPRVGRVRSRIASLLGAATWLNAVGACPCGGTVAAIVDENGGLRLTPDRTAHDSIVDLFSTPMCRKGKVTAFPRLADAQAGVQSAN